MEFTKWVSIEGLHNVLRAIKFETESRSRVAQDGDEEEEGFGAAEFWKQELMSSTTSSPRTSLMVRYKGKVKLHGMNAGVSVGPDAFRVQTRTRLVDDEKGVAGWVKNNASYFTSLWRQISRKLQPAGFDAPYYTLFGEWCGPGIQKGSEVSIGKLGHCIFAVFAIKAGTQLLVDPSDVSQLLIAHGNIPPKDLYILPWFRDIDLDLQNEGQMKGKLPVIDKIVQSVDEEDPWVLDTFGISGPGEGVVWYPMNYAQPMGGFKALPYNAFGCLAFKTKGDRHQMIKAPTKTGGGGAREASSGVTLTARVARNPEEFVEMFLADTRLFQGVQEACGGEILSDTNQKSDFIAWVVKDVKKESVAELEASRLAWYQVEDQIKAKAASWFQQEYAKNMKQHKASLLSRSRGSLLLQGEESEGESVGGGGVVASGVFEGTCFAFSEGFPFGKKGDLSKTIKSHGGEVSYILSKKCTHFLAVKEEVERTHASTKVATAKKYAEERHSGDNPFFIVGEEFIYKCVRAQTKLPEFEFNLLLQNKQQPGEKEEEERGQSLYQKLKNLKEDIGASMPMVWEAVSTNQPYFPEMDYEIVKMDVLQAMDFKDNNNKFYSMELHASNEFGNTGYMYRIFTHHGRTDELEKTKNNGQKECRYLRTLREAELVYEYILTMKMSDEKGYRLVDLVAVSPKIGSPKSISRSSGVFNQTEELDSDDRSQLHGKVQDLVRYLHTTASASIVKTVQAKITTRGIETPLGILSLKQIVSGEKLLMSLYRTFVANPDDTETIERMSQEFYSTIPHNLGRSKEEIKKKIISSVELFEEKLNLLQLMKDIIQVNNVQSRSSARCAVDRMYNALECEIALIPETSPKFRKLADYFLAKKQPDTREELKVLNIYGIKRPNRSRKCQQEAQLVDHTAKRPDGSSVGSLLLFHGSRASNFVGLLSRGILLPKMVLSKGLTQRTDFGFLGHGIYFSDNAYSSLRYTVPPAAQPTALALSSSSGKQEGKRRRGRGKPGQADGGAAVTPDPSYSSTTPTQKEEDRRFMLLVNVYCGRMKDMHKIAPELTRPPSGYDCCHGCPGADSDFKDDEYVIYDVVQQEQEYLVEFVVS